MGHCASREWREGRSQAPDARSALGPSREEEGPRERATPRRRTSDAKELGSPAYEMLG